MEIFLQLIGSLLRKSNYAIRVFLNIVYIRLGKDT